MLYLAIFNGNEEILVFGWLPQVTSYILFSDINEVALMISSSTWPISNAFETDRY